MTPHHVLSIPAELLVWLLAGMGGAGITVGLLIGWSARGKDHR
jgi:hypothetical protein